MYRQHPVVHGSRCFHRGRGQNWGLAISADSRAAKSTPVSLKLEAEGAAAPPGYGDVGEVSGAEHR
jgi:hypothetical protein